MDGFERELVALYPRLSAYALSLTRKAEQAEDLVQETLLKACKARDQFKLGTSMISWTYTIMRNHFLNDKRKERLRRTRSLDDSSHPLHIEGVNGSQLDSLELAEALETLKGMAAEKAEALRLVGLEGHSYEEAAQELGVGVGTIKSRVCRARTELEMRLFEHVVPRA